MADPSAILSFGSQMMQMLPVIFLIVQTATIIFMSMFFGRIIMIGFRTYIGKWKRFPVMFAFGLVAFVCGVGLSSLLDFSSFGMLESFVLISQLDIFIGGLISTIVIVIGVFLVSRNVFNIKGIEGAIAKMQKRLHKAKISASKLGKERAKNPQIIAGILLISVFVLFCMYNFQGLPDMQTRFLSASGISPENLKMLESLGGGNPQCPSFVSLVEPHMDELKNNQLPEYSNTNVRKLIEDNSGSDIVGRVFGIDYNQVTYGIAVTGNGYMCYASQDAFCQCIELAALS